MKRILALLFALLMVFSLAACKKVENTPKTQYDSNDLGSNDKGGDDYVVAITAYDRARYFYSEYETLLKKYGEAKLENGNLKGVAVVRLLDFMGNGNLNMYVAYADGSKPYVNKQMVFGFDNGGSVIVGNTYVKKEGGSVSEDITSLATADAKAPSVWLYTGSTGRGYIVTGDNMTEAPAFNTYFQMYEGEKAYNFKEEKGAVSGGTFEKIDLSGLSEDAFETIAERTEKVVESLKVTAQNKPAK